MFHVKHKVDVSRETISRLQLFASVLRTWNEKINLVSRSDEADIESRHIQDSLQLASLIPPGVKRALDLGSGAGFPGIVLALATGIHFTLVESDTRKCAFLREAGRLTGAPVSVVNGRIESVQLPLFPLITARALAPLPRLLDLCAPFLASGGWMLFPKGVGVDAEIAEAESVWTMKIERRMSQTGDGVILRIGGAERA